MAEARVQRRLAAILAADVAGYSRMVAHDEEGTLRTLGLYRAVIADLIAEHDGRVFSAAGDSVLAEFASAVQAVRAAVAMQRALQRRNADLPAAQRMEFRIGHQPRRRGGGGRRPPGRRHQRGRPAAGAGAARRHLHLRRAARADRGQADLSARRPRRAGAEEHPAPGDGLSGRLGGRGRDRGGDAGRRRAQPAGQAVDRGAAVRQHERRSRPGIFRRRDHRGHHHRAVALSLVLRDRAQLHLRLQEAAGRGREAGGARAGRALRAGGQRAQGGQPDPRHRAAGGGGDRQPRVGRALRPRPGGHLRPAGRDHAERGRRRRARDAARRGAAGDAQERRQPRRLRLLDARGVAFPPSERCRAAPGGRDLVPAGDRDRSAVQPGPHVAGPRAEPPGLVGMEHRHRSAIRPPAMRRRRAPWRSTTATPTATTRCRF